MTGITPAIGGHSMGDGVAVTAQRALGRAALTAWLRSEAADDAAGTTVEIKGPEAA